MASEKNLKLKKDLVSEINSKVENASIISRLSRNDCVRT